MTWKGSERRAVQCTSIPDCPMEEKVQRMYRDFYFGDGPDDPPFTTRMLLVEKNQANSGAMLTRIEKVAGKIALLLLAAVVTGIADIVVHALTK